jgi:hypothetical protein
VNVTPDICFWIRFDHEMMKVAGNYWDDSHSNHLFIQSRTVQQLIIIFRVLYYSCKQHLRRMIPSASGAKRHFTLADSSLILTSRNPRGFVDSSARAPLVLNSKDLALSFDVSVSSAGKQTTTL